MTTYKIQANPSGTRSIDVTERHLKTIDDHHLFRNLIDSNGYVDEQVLEKLRLNVRSLLEAGEGNDKNLLDLCLDVIYNANMKAFGLQQLVLLFINWKNSDKQQDSEEEAGSDTKDEHTTEAGSDK